MAALAGLKTALYIAAGVVFAILALLLWHERNRADEAVKEQGRLSEQVTGLLKINADQGAAIAKLANQQVINDKLVTAFSVNLAMLRDQSAATEKSISDLVTSDPDAAKFLDLPLPDSVKRLYGKTPGTGASAPGRADRATGRPASQPAR